uniref:Uncharacterized protein n=1 Tax=Steinernema glaseri TaxID=37863 RepID=A0A1I7Z124_9BILA
MVVHSTRLRPWPTNANSPFPSETSRFRSAAPTSPEESSTTPYDMTSSRNRPPMGMRRRTWRSEGTATSRWRCPPKETR